MTANDFLMFVWHYRENPKPSEVHHVFSFIEAERLSTNPLIALAISGVVTALCDRHHTFVDFWLQDHRALIKQCCAVAKDRKSKTDIRYPEYLVNRWLILATDESAWDLLVLCHYANSRAQQDAAQNACDKICRSVEGKPMTDSKGNLVGTVYFEDMRLQMVRLANEFRKFTTAQRQQPFDRLPFSQESVNAQLMQSANLSPLAININNIN